MLRLAPFALLLPAVASASVVWKGDFETGNTSQFDGTQSVASDRLQVVSSPVREGRYALKVTVRQGDNPINASGNRNELLYMDRAEPGTEYFYKWSTLFPSSFPRSPKWALFTQWHHDGNTGSPPLEFFVVDDEMRLRLGGSSGQVVWRAPLQREHWNDFIMHVKWSPDSNTGFVELYHDGKVVLPLTKVATQFAGQRNYLKVGLYRDASIAPEGVVFHDGYTMATRLEEVMPTAVASPAPANDPSPDAPGSVSAPAPDEGSSPVASPNTQTPPDSSGASPDTGAVVPGDPMLGAGMPPSAGCGASSTGGAPLLAVAGLTLLALLGRRKMAPASTRTPRR